MFAIASSLGTLPLGVSVDLDTASAVVIAMVLGAVVLVFWASRPSVIARYSVQNTHPAETPADPPAPAPAAHRAKSRRP